MRARAGQLYPEWPLAALRHMPTDIVVSIAAALMKINRYHPAVSEAALPTHPLTHSNRGLAPFCFSSFQPLLPMSCFDRALSCAAMSFEYIISH